MSFEDSSRHIPADEEPKFEHVEEISMESLSGPLAEGFRMCFDSKQIKEFIKDVFESYEIELSLIQHIPDEDVQEVIAISAGYFDLSKEEQEIRAKKIAERIQSIASSRMEEVSGIK